MLLSAKLFHPRCLNSNFTHSMARLFHPSCPSVVLCTLHAWGHPSAKSRPTAFVRGPRGHSERHGGERPHDGLAAVALHRLQPRRAHHVAGLPVGHVHGRGAGAHAAGGAGALRKVQQHVGLHLHGDHARVPPRHLGDHVLVGVGEARISSALGAVERVGRGIHALDDIARTDLLVHHLHDALRQLGVRGARRGDEVALVAVAVLMVVHQWEGRVVPLDKH
mmetsp:Transcript_89153/g.255267  ORF Transcript_89153/g.255267 Transcript_89153/m.255267 type:complete len:221 (+) Transcript_89153:71-733(+)